MSNARELVGPVAVELAGDPVAVARVASCFATDASSARPARVVRLVARSGEPLPPAEPVMHQPGVIVGRESGGALRITARGVSAELGDEVCLRIASDASPAAVEAVFLAVWPLVLPRHGLVHVHGAAVRDPEGAGWLLAGAGGSGKSTSTLALVRSGWSFAADDSVFTEQGARGELVAHGWREPVRLSPRSANALGVALGNPATMHKSAARLDAELEARRCESVSIDRVLIPELGPRTALERLPPAEALFHVTRASGWIVALPERAPSYLARLAAIAAHPIFRLVLGPELLEHPGQLARHLRLASEALA